MRFWIDAARRGLAVAVVGYTALALGCLPGWYWRLGTSYPLYAVAYAFLISVCFGVFGRGFGLSDLFWHERRGLQFTAGLGVAALVTMMGMISYEIVQDHDGDSFRTDMRNFRDLSPFGRLARSDAGQVWPVDLWEVISGLETSYAKEVAAKAEAMIPKDAPEPAGGKANREKLKPIVGDRLPLSSGALQQTELRKDVFQSYLNGIPPAERPGVLMEPGVSTMRNRLFLFYASIALPWTLVLCLPAILRGRRVGERDGREMHLMSLGAGGGWWFVLGASVAIGATLVGVQLLPGRFLHLASTSGYFEWMRNPDSIPWILKGLVANPSLFIQVVFSQLLFGAGLLLLLAMSWIPGVYRRVSPPLSLCLILALAILLYGFYIHLEQLNAFAQIAFAALVGLGILSQNSGAFKLRFPAMTIGDGTETYYRSVNRVPIEALGAARPSRGDGDGESGPVSGLLDSQAVLERWRERLGRAGAGRKPVLAVVTTSGGSLRAAVWTAKVLTTLEREIDGFPYHVRLITGASGGMLGGGLYAAGIPAPARSRGGPSSRGPAELDAVVASLPRDCLSPVARCLALRDLPGLFSRGPMRTDRGRALEEVWEREARPLAKPFRRLATGEAKGWRPSLVFSPMLVEDGRRLLISNLDLGHITSNVGPCLLDEGSRLLDVESRSHPEEDVYSFSGYQFYDLFPRASRFRLSTAIRMSATFPFVSPAVSLPTRPPRRVVDAGYYDNFGVDVASMWIIHHRRWILENTSGVVLVQVRAFSSPRKVDPPARPMLMEDPRDDRTWRNGFRFVTSPLEGLMQARRAVMSFRNDQQLEMIADWFEDNADRPSFFQNVTFECPASASLNWFITADEHADILACLEPGREGRADTSAMNLERLAALKEWWAGAGVA